MVDGPGAISALAGGQPIYLLGSNLGPVDNTTSVTARASPANSDLLVFEAVNCTVTRDHVNVTCITTESIGTSLSWRVVVEGQSNTLPVSHVAPPTITGVALEGGLFANTTGGTPLRVLGRNFGSRPAFVLLQVTMAAAVVDRIPCNVSTSDVALLCALPAGLGLITKVVVSVLGQDAAFSPYVLQAPCN
jgi:hypothetical protein